MCLLWVSYSRLLSMVQSVAVQMRELEPARGREALLNLGRRAIA